MKNLIILAVFAFLFLACSQEEKRNPDMLPWNVESEKPTIIHAGWVDKGILGITIKEGNLVRSSLIPYTEQNGDSVSVIIDSNGQVKRRILFREGEAIGHLAGADHSHLSIFEKVTGDTLDQRLLGQTTSYTLFTDGNKSGFHPDEVFRKSKILTKSNVTNQIAMLHKIYLRVPDSSKDFKTIRINFGGLNLDQSDFVFFNDPQNTRSESVHVTHSGFRSDDPVKRGYLSIWLGTGGGHSFEEIPEFQVLEKKTGKVRYEGMATLAIALDGTEMLKEEKNYSKTEVWHLDFSDLNLPGEFVLYIKGVGTSFPFRIGDDVWKDNFITTMLGFLTHRSGIAIEEEMNVNFVRPRSFHPQDGVVVYDSDFSQIDLWADYGGSQDGAFTGLIRNKTENRRTDAWGGYMDAGDWDRRIPHLNSTRQLLELYQMYPEYFSKVKLTLPEEEMNNHIPDILDEVAWNVDCYGRMQGSEGGISLGIESAAHPVEGEPSWMESLDILRFSEDPHSSFIYAGVAAQLSRAIEKYDPNHAANYKESAIRTFDYAARYESHPRFMQLSPGNIRAIRDQAAIAAIEMYKLTGEGFYYDIFRKYSVVFDREILIQNSGLRQLDAAFSLATANPDQIIHEKDISKAKEFILAHADRMLTMLHGNTYSIVNRVPDVQVLNGYYSAANNQEICRAYYITGEKKYLEGAILSVMYTSGANPMNMTMTTGLGHNFPHRPLHLDSEFTGQWAPHGITVYAQADHEYYQKTLPYEEVRRAWGTWATYWFSGKLNTPSGWDWPPHEAYIDYSRFPSMNEYTIHQTFGPISYAYGFLAARDKLLTDH
jgi:endoglucanase